MSSATTPLPPHESVQEQTHLCDKVQAAYHDENNYKPILYEPQDPYEVEKKAWAFVQETTQLPLGVLGVYFPGSQQAYVLETLPVDQKRSIVLHEYIHHEFAKYGLEQSEVNVDRSAAQYAGRESNPGRNFSFW